MNSRHRVVRIVIKCIGAYMMFNICGIISKEYVLQEARTIREQQIRFGGDFQLSQEKQKILKAADEYTENHMGLRYLNRMRTEEFFQQQLTKKLKQKEEQLQQASSEDVEKVQKLKSHIEQLQRAYTSVLPKMPSSWEDLKEKDDDQ